MQFPGTFRAGSPLVGAAAIRRRRRLRLRSSVTKRDAKFIEARSSSCDSILIGLVIQKVGLMECIAPVTI